MEADRGLGGRVQLKVQLPDISELGNIDKEIKVEFDKQYVFFGDFKTPLNECLKDAEERAQTELIFASLPYYDEVSNRYLYQTYKKCQDLLQENGWWCIAKTLNWHRLHNGDHPIGLWIKKLDGKPNVWGPLKDRKRHISPAYNVAGENVVFGFGCGGRLVDGLTKEFKSTRHKALTLLRIPIEQSLSVKDFAWLRKYNYRSVISTKLANYYVNGWHPSQYNEQYERAYWAGWEAHQKSLVTPRGAHIAED